MVKQMEKEYLERIMAKCLRQNDDCLIWQGPVHKKDGSPIAKIDGKQVRVRSFLYEHEFGYKPKKTYACPKNSKCVEPKHCNTERTSVSISEKLQNLVQLPNPRMTTPCHLFQNQGLRITYPKFSHGGKTLYAHRENYKIHHGPIPFRMHIHHKCNDKRCFNIEHLELVTAKRNSEHAKADGLLTGGKTTGEKHGNCKTNNGAVIDIRMLKEQGQRTKDIANKYGRHRSYITNLMAGHLRKDVRLLNTSKLNISVNISMEKEGQETSEENVANERQEIRIIADDNGSEIYAQNFDRPTWTYMKDAQWAWFKEICKNSKILHQLDGIEVIFE